MSNATHRPDTRTSRRRSEGLLSLFALILTGLLALPALAQVTLTDYPQEMVGIDEYVTVSWEEPVRCRLAYGRLPGLYTSVTDADGWGTLGFSPQSEGMTPGVFYCVARVDGTGETSDEFVLVVESPIFPSPRTPTNGGVVTSTTTVFSWEPVMGVPFYHVLVSDHPINIEENEHGDLAIAGANIIWQAITGNTSIQFGGPDPSGHFTETNGAAPPLMDDFEYNWLILNNFGNHPLLTSIAGAGISGFTVDTGVSLDTPPLSSPPADVILTEDLMVFDWEPVADAVSYHLYLYEEREWDAGDASYPVWDGATNDTALEVNLGNFLVSGEYAWRVLALDSRGRGRPSELRKFEYATETGTAHIVTRREGPNPLPRVLVEIERSDSGLEALPAITNDSGVFDSNLKPGDYLFHASRTDYADTTVTASIRAGQTTNVTITMHRAPARVRGFVKDESGIPVFDADVVAKNGPATAEATTDSRGSFVLDVTSGPWSISASKTGYAPSDTASVALSAGDYVELPDPLVLEGTPGFASGSVVNIDGNPIVGATVRATSPIGDVVDASGAAGHFRLELAPGHWSVVAAKPGFRPSEERVIEITPGNDTPVDPALSLLPVDSAVLGRVSDGDYGVAGATVIAAPQTGAAVTAETNSRGEFVMLPPAGTYSLIAYHDGFCPSAEHQVTVENGASFTGVELVLGPPECVLEGRVGDGSRSVEDAVVSAGIIETTTGPDGSFSLGLPTGVHELHARKSGHACGAPLIVAAGDGQTVEGLVLTLTPGAAVVSGLVSSNEAPVPFAAVEAVSRGTRITARSDAAGAYELALEVGTWTFVARKRGFAASDPETLSLAPGQSVSGVELFPTPHAARVNGTVSDAGGVVRRAAVLFFEDGMTEPSRRSSSGMDGGYVALLEPDMGYTMVVRAAGHAEQSFSVGPFAAGSDHTANVVLPVRPGSVEGRVIGSSGGPVGGAVVRSDDTGALTRSDGQGRYVIWLRSGLHDIVVSAPGYETRRFPDTYVSSSGPVQLDCTLNELLGSVTGAVADSLTAEPVDGALLTLVWGDGGRSFVTDVEGAYELDDVVPGDARLICSCQGYRSRTLPLTIMENEWRELDIELFQYSGTIAGSVLKGDGVTPVDGASVRATFDGSLVASTVTAADGAFALGGLEAGGTYDISATAPGFYAVSANPVEALDAGTMDVVFLLEPCTGTVSGVVVDDVSGEPVQGASLAVDDGDGHSGTAMTDEAGSFTIDSLPPTAVFTLEAAAYGYHDATVDSIGGSAGPVSVRLDRNFARLEGHLSPLGDVSVAELLVVATNTSYAEHSRSVACEATGDYVVEEVKPGTYVVSVSGDGCLGDPLQTTVMVAEGQTASGLDFTVEKPPVEAIEVSGPGEVCAGHIVTFAGSAVTDEGQLVDTELEWWVSPSVAGSMSRSSGTFQAAPDYIGEARIGASDPTSGLRGALEISSFISIGPATSMSVADSAGMLLTIPAGSVADEQTISLAHELLPDAKRLGRDYEVSEMSCHLMPDGLTFQVAPTITMPAADGTSRLVRWNEDRLEWNELDASPSASELTADISELGEYAVSRPSRPLGVWGITAEPNPFSPDEGPVEIRFDVSSIDVRSPFVTLRVRNVQGQIVRTIVENEPAPKGEVVVEWDGLSDDGAEARNGRYIIEVIAEDAGSEETSLGTVVLIK